MTKRIILGVLALLLIVLGGAYLTLQNNNPKQIIKTIPTPTRGLMDSWKTYTSPNGYSFKYPENMTIKVSPDTTSFAYEVQLENADYNVNFRKPIITSNSMEDEVNQYLFSYDEKTLNKDSQSVSGKSAYRAMGNLKIDSTKTIPSIIEMIQLNDGKYLLIEANATNQSLETLSESLNSILSTIKFD